MKDIGRWKNFLKTFVRHKHWFVVESICGTFYRRLVTSLELPLGKQVSLSLLLLSADRHPIHILLYNGYIRSTHSFIWAYWMCLSCWKHVQLHTDNTSLYAPNKTRCAHTLRRLSAVPPSSGEEEEDGHPFPLPWEAPVVTVYIWTRRSLELPEVPVKQMQPFLAGLHGIPLRDTCFTGSCWME